MHRFIALVDPRGLVHSPRELVASVRSKTERWQIALEAEIGEAWVFTSPFTRLAHRSLERSEGVGCLIGRDFPRNKVDASSGCFDKLLQERWGAYVAVRVEADRPRIRVLRDPSGRVSCWKYSRGGVHLFFSHLDDVIDIIGYDLTLNWNFLLFHSTNRSLHGRGTGFNEITEIMPGEEISLTPAGEDIARPWNILYFRRNSFASIEEAQKSIRSAAEEAVSCWSQLYSTITLDLSGGLDSAIVLGLLRRSAGDARIVGVNHVIEHPEGDEREFARDAARFHSIELIEIDMREARRLSAPEIRHRLLRPGLRLIPLGYDQAGILAAHQVNAEAFFTGTGGDHLFHHNMTPAIVIDHYRADGLRGFFSAAHSSAQICRTTIWDPIGRLSKWILGQRTRLGQLVQLDHPLLSQEQLSWQPTDDLIDPTLLSSIGALTPAELHQITDLIELQSHYWRFGRAEELDEVHPFVSQPLLNAILRTKMHWFAQDGVRRGMAKSVFSDLIPESILTRRSKSSNSSHWVSSVLAEIENFKTLLLDGRLASEGLLRRDKVEMAITPLGLIEGKFFSELMNLISIEQWLRSVSMMGER